MMIKKIVAGVFVAVALAGCGGGGGDVDLTGTWKGTSNVVINGVTYTGGGSVTMKRQ